MLITLDYETYYDNVYSLKKMPTIEYLNDERFFAHGVALKADLHPTEWYTAKDIESVVKDIFKPGNDHTLLAHNTAFDGMITVLKYGVTPAYYADTLSMSRGIFPGLAHNLGELCQRLFNDNTVQKGDELSMSEGVQRLDTELDKIIGDYSINDVDICYLAYNMMIDYLPQEELDLINLIIRMYCEPHCILDKRAVIDHQTSMITERKAIIQASGISRERLLQLNVEHPVHDKFEGVEFQQKFLACGAFPKYVEALGIPVPLKRNDKNTENIPAFAKNDLQFHAIQRKYPEHQNLWDARIAVKSTSEISRCERLLVATVGDDLLPIPLKYSGAANTHRLSGGEKINLQNLKRGSTLRRSIKAPNGYQIATADSSQIEARVLCDLAGQKDVLEQFRAGEDTYSTLATSIFGFEVSKKHFPDERFVGKIARLGLGYGMGGTKFGDTLRSGAMGHKVPVSDEEANRIVYNVFRPENKHIVSMWDEAQHVWLRHMLMGKGTIEYGPLTIARGMIILPNGMQIHYPNLKFEVDPYNPDKGQWSYFDGRKRVKIYGGKLVENVTQALARIIILYMGLEIDTWLAVNDAGWVIHSVHDETVSAIKKETVEAYSTAVTNIMVRPPIWMPNLPLDLEIIVGDRYEK